MKDIPTLAAFLAAPVEEVRQVAPSSLLYCPGGTRRAAVLEGIEPWSKAFMQWARERLLNRLTLLFQHGIHHVVAPFITPNNVQEVHRHRDQLFRQVEPMLAGPEALACYQALDLRVRLLGGDHIPEIRATAARLQAMTANHCGPTLYWLAVIDQDEPWRQLLQGIQHSQAQTQAEAIRAVYGEEIPPISIFLSFGKPEISVNLIPPLLLGNVQCYWSQQPGYHLTETQLRTILYDYAYLRGTWQADKLDRAQAALEHPQAWEKGPLLGIGMRLGPFWYPAPMSSPAWRPTLEPANATLLA
ncbi:MAG: hypothetical protein KF832_19145 [Caldilineaceae bacterium]|nr:hypothetical protein [Caldilineaceae bacterium]